MSEHKKQQKDHIVSEYKKEQKERAWGDRIPDEEDEQKNDTEKTYRDGSLINECWNSDRENV